MCALRRPETLPEAVAKHIRDAIVRGDYPPGAALPEVRLAEELEISRGTVREALRALEDQGLVEVVPHRGSFVSRVTRKTARDVYELRAVLEAYAVRLSVERGWFAGTGRRVLEDRLAALEAAAATGDRMAVIETERALHREMWTHCGNEQLLAFMSVLQVQTRRLLMFNRAFRSEPDEEVRDHRDIVATLLTNDADAAEVAIRRHVLRAAEAVISRIPEDQPPGAGPRGADADVSLGEPS